MVELTLEQKRAIALGRARARAAAAGPGAGQEGTPASADPSLTERAMGALRSVTEGGAFGYGDEGSALLEAILGDPKTNTFFDYSRPFSQRYNSGVEQEKAKREAFAERNPALSTGLEIGGALGTGMGLARGGLTVAGKMAPVGAAALEGAAYGGLYGSGKAEPGQRLEGAAGGAAAGAVGGAALGAAGQKVASVLEKAFLRGKAPALDTIKKGADAAYGAARAKNPTFPGFDAFASQAVKVLDGEGFHPRLHPRLAIALEEFGKAGPKPDFKTIEKLRRIARSAGSDFTNPDQQRLGAMLVRGLDNFVEQTSPMPEVGIGRALYGRYKRGDLIEKAIETARHRASRTGSGGNLQNTLRQEIGKIVDKPKLRAGFSDAEIKAMNEFAHNDGTIRQFLRVVGKLSPGGSALMAAIGGVGGAGAYSTGNPLFLAPFAAGMAAKGFGNAAEMAGARNIAALTRSGGQSPAYTPPALMRNKEALIRALNAYLGGGAGAITGSGASATAR